MGGGLGRNRKKGTEKKTLVKNNDCVDKKNDSVKKRFFKSLRGDNEVVGCVRTR